MIKYNTPILEHEVAQMPEMSIMKTLIMFWIPKTMGALG
jgi:hypothetical protein